MNKPLVVAVVVFAVALGAGWYALSTPRAAESEVEALAARPRAERAQVARDVELDALLSEILREPIAASDGDEIAPEEDPGGSPTRPNAPAQDADDEPEASTDLSKLVLLDREPNLLRVEGLEGPAIQRRWPNGALMLAARQTRNDEGLWALDGAWRAWFSDGVLEESGEYRGDLEHGKWTWYWANGALQAEGEFAHGSRVGCWRFWHPNGVVIGEGCYEGGVRSGRWEFRRADGSAVDDYTGQYRDGHRVGP